MASVFRSEVDTTSDAYKQNYAAMTALVNDLGLVLKKHCSEGKEKSIKRHKSRGQLTFRERLNLLLDEDSPFLELMPLAGYGQQDCPYTGCCGIGLVNGIEVVVGGSIPTVKGGTSNEMAVIKNIRNAEIILQNKLPMISLTQSGGADLTQQERVFHNGGKNFYNLARMSQEGCTTITVVFGSSTAGGAYQPGMSDYSVLVKDKAQVFLGGPPLVKMATGEIATAEQLGGALMHSVKSGVSDFIAEDERQAIRIARELVNVQHRTKGHPYPVAHLGEVEPPAYDPEELMGIFSGDIKKPFDISEVIARIVDGSRITFFKPEYGKTTICAFAKIHGFPIGFLANNGVLMPDSTQKATQFIHRCNREGTPIIFLHNITGFMVGTESEQDGIIKHGSLLINAVSNSVVPLISILVGASYGAGNYAMCGRSYNPRFLFSWPCSKCGVMGPEQLSGVLDEVARKGIQGLPPAQLAKAEKMLEMRKQKFAKDVEKTIDVYYTSSKCLDDGIIDPRDTREVLGFCLSIIHNNVIRSGGISGVSRM
eukprot:TRINITY_DN4428_c1_g1_i1.p1 TRINITY_DN4428_c1_g1~~TRINITY_DN4428_c1_g1_i1.p1  ORF type:complete len:555 (+),score=111.72 TRINITY_DN4428_c1_g1_i1:53-1666(+)